MFLHWKGFEIDGSDTDYDIILPESAQTAEFVECFLNMPIFDMEFGADFYSMNSNKRKKYTREELIECIRNNVNESLYIDVNCLHMELMPKELKEELCKFSEQREPHEGAYGKVSDPCMGLQLQNVYNRGSATVSLTIMSKDNYKNRMEYEFEKNGYEYNSNVINEKNPLSKLFVINCGPGFFFEYAMYIMEYMKNRFPSIGISGGLDCAGGWTEGCTYADSIYGYERIFFPVKYSVKNFMKRICEVDLIFPCKTYYKNGYRYEKSPHFSLVNHPYTYEDFKKNPELKKKVDLSFTEYIEKIEKELENPSNKTIFNLAVEVMIPVPEDEGSDKSYKYKGFLSFCMHEGLPTAVILVNWYMKEYFMDLVKKWEDGKLDFMKEITYKERHKDD